MFKLLEQSECLIMSVKHMRGKQQSENHEMRSAENVFPQHSFGTKKAIVTVPKQVKAGIYNTLTRIRKARYRYIWDNDKIILAATWHSYSVNCINFHSQAWMFYKSAKSTFKNWKTRYKHDYLSIINCGPRLRSNWYFQMQQFAHCRLITLFASLSEVLHRKARVPEATHGVPNAEYSWQNKRRHASSLTKAAKMQEKEDYRMLINHCIFKPSQLDVEMYKLGYWRENRWKKVVE